MASWQTWFTLISLGVLSAAPAWAQQSYDTEVAPGIIGYQGQLTQWDRFVSSPWDLTRATRQLVDTSHSPNLRPYAIGRMIKASVQGADIMVLLDEVPTYPGAHELLERGGYFEIIRVATRSYETSLVYVGVDEAWARSILLATPPVTLKAGIRGVFHSRELTQLGLIEELTALTQGMPRLMWQLKQVDTGGEVWRLSLRLREFKEGAPAGTRIVVGMELLKAHEVKVVSRDITRGLSLGVAVLGLLGLVLWYRQARERSVRFRRWENERDEKLCPRCGSGEVVRPGKTGMLCERCGWRPVKGAFGLELGASLDRLERLRDAIASLKTALVAAHAADPHNLLTRQLHQLTRGWTRQLAACDAARVHLQAGAQAAREALAMTPAHQRERAYWVTLSELIETQPVLTREEMFRWRAHVLEVHDALEMVEAELELEHWCRGAPPRKRAWRHEEEE